jgi:hypothetical protein
MTLPASGEISLNDINVETGRTGTTANTSLKNMSDGTTITINTGNASADRPDGSAPHAMTEFYNYDHDLASTSWSNVSSDFTLSGVNGGSETSPGKSIQLTGGSGNTTVSRTTTGSPVITFTFAYSTSGDPGVFGTSNSGSGFVSFPQTFSFTSGTLYLRFKAVHSPNKDGTGVATISFTNNSVTNTDLDVTFNFGGGGGGFP